MTELAGAYVQMGIFAITRIISQKRSNFQDARKVNSKIFTVEKWLSINRPTCGRPYFADRIANVT